MTSAGTLFHFSSLSSTKLTFDLLSQIVPFINHMKFSVSGVGMALQKAGVQDADRDKRPRAPENHGLLSLPNGTQTWDTRTKFSGTRELVSSSKEVDSQRGGSRGMNF